MIHNHANRETEKLQEKLQAFQELAKIATDARKLQTDWLTARGLTWAQARALDARGRAALQAAWSDHYAKRCSEEII
jgi:hypothetical protein